MPDVTVPPVIFRPIDFTVPVVWVIFGIWIFSPIQLIVPAAVFWTSAPAVERFEPYILNVLVVVWVSAGVDCTILLSVQVPPVPPQAVSVGEMLTPFNVCGDVPVVLNIGETRRPLVVVVNDPLVVSLTVSVSSEPVSDAPWVYE